MMLREALERAWWQPRTSLAAALLAPLSVLYGLLRWLAQLGWRRGWRQPWRAPVPVLVVGNLVVGGAGKTPAVIALAQALGRRGWRPGIVSRGYGAREADVDGPQQVHADSSAHQVGDEPLLMARRTGRPVWVGARRVGAAKALCAHHPEVDLIISDDGLQHLALQRDAQLVLFDDRGAGNGRLLPAGPLREPLPERLPARTLVLYNAARPSTSLPGDCAGRRLAGIQPLAAWRRQEPVPPSMDAWRGRRVLAAAGIGHPERFFTMLEQAGLQVERLPLADHAPLHPLPWPAQTPVVVVTEKDAVKLPPSPHNGSDPPDTSAIHVATLDFAIPDTTVDALERMLLPLRKH
ncbi:MAG: tetraacyldisaccharide 4'-kinase [Betaproteobacteria bacterium]